MGKKVIASATDSCPCCSSGKMFKDCCGELLPPGVRVVFVLPVKREDAKYFIACNPYAQQVYEDSDGHTPVFESIKQAALFAHNTRLAVMGLTEKRFPLFCASVPDHYMVPASEVLA